MSKRAKGVFGTPAKPKNADGTSANGGSGPMAGNWSRIAYQGMEDKLKGRTEELEAIRSNQASGILSGEIPVRVPADAIEDAIGTDRIANAPDNADEPSSFESLVENIRMRGLRTPIRVRPVDPDWRPNLEDPTDMSGQKFLLQSGRRRLAACKQLGINPIAFLSFSEDGLTRVEDLQERYFENVSRRDLTSIEKLFSIGLLAESMDIHQAQIADILQVAQATVSKGVNFYRNFEAISDLIDLGTSTIKDVELALRALKETDTEPKTESPPKAASLPFEQMKIGSKAVKLSQTNRGVRTLTIRSDDLSDEALETIIKTIKDLR